MRTWTPPPAEITPDIPPNATSGDTPTSSNNAVEENQGEVEKQTGNEIDAPSQQELMERMRLEARTTAQRIREMARLEGRRAASECREPAPTKRRSSTPDPLAGIPRLNTFQSTGEQAKNVHRLSIGGGRTNDLIRSRDSSIRHPNHYDYRPRHKQECQLGSGKYQLHTCPSCRGGRRNIKNILRNRKQQQ